MRNGARTNRMLAVMSKRKFMSSCEISQKCGMSYQWVSWRLRGSTDIVDIMKIKARYGTRYVKMYRLI